MGQLLGGGGLTTPGSALTDSSGQTAVGSPNQVLTAADRALKAKTQASQVANLSGSPDDMSTGQGQLPTVGTPSFLQASQSGAPVPGGMNAMSPALNKAGKLVTLLQSGLQGAMAGRAASENAVVASGGRRSGGAGMGFEAAQAYPWQKAGMAQEYEKGQAQVGLLKAQSDMVPTQYGPMPAALARYILPAQIRGEAQQGAAQTRAGATTGAAQINAGARTGAAQIGADARVKAAQLGLGPIAQVPQELQDQLGLPAELPIKMLNQAESAANRPLTTVAGADDSYLVNRQTGAKTALGVGNRAVGAANARPVQVGDPNNPGGTVYTTAGSAIKSGAAGPQSASVQVPKAMAKSATSGPIGDQITAFNTAIQHAQLLTQVATALKNGDNRTVAGLKNRLQSEFGSSNLNDFNTVANVYNNEINKMLGGGNATIEDLKTSGATLPSNANLDTLLSAIGNYKKLAQSKMNVLQQRVQQGMKGKPDFPGASTPGVTHVFVPGKGLQPATP